MTKGLDMMLVSEDAMKLTISDIWVEHYFPTITKRRRANTVGGYESSARLYVLPQWGELTISEITRDEVQDWVDELSKTDAGTGGAWKAFKTFRQIVNWAIAKWGMYVANPTIGVEKPRGPVYRTETLTQRRLKRLIRGFVGHEHEPTLIIQAALGLRPGENYYLHWESINWRTGLVKIVGTLQQVRGKLYEYPTKTAKSERELYLPPWALDRLHDLWVALGRPKGRIIGDAMPSKVRSAIRRHIIRNRLPYIAMRNLRHTWATIAAASKVPIEVVAAMLGHSNVNTCYRYYVALTNASMRRAQRKVSRTVMGKCEDMYKGIILRLPQAPNMELPMAA